MKMKKRMIAVLMLAVMCIVSPFAAEKVSAATDYETLLNAENGEVSNSVSSHYFENKSKRKVIVELAVMDRDNIDVSLTNTATSEKIDKTITSSMWDYDSTYGYYFYDLGYSSLAAGSYQVDVKSTSTIQYVILVVGEKKVMTISASKATITAGQKKTLKVKDAPGAVKWKSSKTSVATVSSKGVVKAKKAGTATITATSGDQKVTCKVTVKKNVYNATKLTMTNAAPGAVSIHAHNAYYKSGKIVCKVNIVNKSSHKVAKFKNISIVVKSASGKVIAKQTYKNVKGTMSTYSKKSKTFTIDKKHVKNKNADLRNAVVIVDGVYQYNIFN